METGFSVGREDDFVNSSDQLQFLTKACEYRLSAHDGGDQELLSAALTQVCSLHFCLLHLNISELLCTNSECMLEVFVAVHVKHGQVFNTTLIFHTFCF